MVVKLSDRYTFEKKLEVAAGLEYVPQNISIEELIENVLDIYQLSLEETNKDYFKVDGDKYKDVMKFVKYFGGFKKFDIELCS